MVAHQENEKTGKREANEERKSRQISERLRAALLRSCRGQHGEKMVCLRGVIGPSGKPTVISTKPKRDRGPHHYIKAAVDWCGLLLYRSEY